MQLQAPPLLHIGMLPLEPLQEQAAAGMLPLPLAGLLMALPLAAIDGMKPPHLAG